MIRSLVGVLFITALKLAAQAGDCNAAAPSPSITVALPASPFMVAPSKDGCWVFVSMPGRGDNSGIALLKRSGGKEQLVRVAPLQSAPTGITLTHDGKLLIAAATTAAVFVDVNRLISGAGDPVAGTISGGRGS